MPAFDRPGLRRPGDDREGDPPGTRDFNSMYEGTPPWDIGRPQPAIAALAGAGWLEGPVLDAGCGTGEHALLAASLGLEAVGIDQSPMAIAIAWAKAESRDLRVEFINGDALKLGELGRQFATVIDSGLFHVFGDGERERYVESLAAAVMPEARLCILCFSDAAPGSWGPRRISEAEIRATFSQGWEVESIEPSRLEVIFAPEGIPAWLALLRRTTV